MDTAQEYTLVSTNCFTLAVGTAADIIEHLTSTDVTLSGLHLTKKPRVYWKEGLSDKAKKV